MIKIKKEHRDISMFKWCMQGHWWQFKCNFNRGKAVFMSYYRQHRNVLKKVDALWCIVEYPFWETFRHGFWIRK